MNTNFPFVGYFLLCVAIVVIVGALSYVPFTHERVCAFRPIDANANISECK